MSAKDAALAEGQFVRTQLLQFLGDCGFALILESDSSTDGWRAEFLGQIDDVDVVVTTHKPFAAPFVTLGMTVFLSSFEAQTDCMSLMDRSSDFDVACYLSESNLQLVTIASRILLSGVNEYDFTFVLNNLLHCRQAIVSCFGHGDDR